MQIMFVIATIVMLYLGIRHNYKGLGVVAGILIGLSIASIVSNFFKIIQLLIKLILELTVAGVFNGSLEKEQLLNFIETNNSIVSNIENISFYSFSVGFGLIGFLLGEIYQEKKTKRRLNESSSPTSNQ